MNCSPYRKNWASKIGFTVTLSLFAISCSDEEAAAPIPNVQMQKQVICVGSISDDPLNSMRRFQGFVDHLNRVYSDSDYTFEANTARSVEEAIGLIQQQEIQIFIDSPLVVYHMQRNAPIEVELIRWKREERDYSSVIYTSKTSDVRTLSDLLGKRIGFEDSWSSSAYFLPRAHLERNGLATIETEISQSFNDPGKVGYVFTDDDETTLVWVLIGKLAAGATNPYELSRLAGGDTDKLRIIAETVRVPRHVVAMHAHMHTDLRRSLIAHLVRMHENPEYQSVLSGLSDTTRFEIIEDKRALKEAMLEILEVVAL